MISGGNIKLNFNESFKNLAQYFLYFDQSDLIYTDITGTYKHRLSFSKSMLTFNASNELQYPIKSNKDLQIRLRNHCAKDLN
jgi:hypothetical protein